MSTTIEPVQTEIDNKVEEFEEWTELMSKDIQVKKIVAGSGGDTASYGMTVTCNLKGYFKESNTPFEVLSRQKFKVGEGDAIPGLELALRHSRIGEIFRVRCTSRFAYGPNKRPSLKMQMGDATNGSTENITDLKMIEIPEIPPDSDLEYEVEVIGHTAENEVDWDLIQSALSTADVEELRSADEKQQNRLVALSNLMLRKESGNRWYMYQDYGRAAKAYSKGTQVADNYFKSTESANDDSGVVDGNPNSIQSIEARYQKQQTQQTAAINDLDKPIVLAYVSCLNNLAACHICTGNNLKAKEMCIKVLEFDSNNVKALLRAAKATLALSDFEECALCIERALVLDPSNNEAKKIKIGLAVAKKEYKEKLRSMAKNMLGKTPSTAKTADQTIETMDESKPEVAIVNRSEQNTASHDNGTTQSDVPVLSGDASTMKGEKGVSNEVKTSKKPQGKKLSDSEHHHLNLYFLFSTSILIIIISVGVGIYLTYN